MGRKLGALPPYGGWLAESPCNRIWPGPRPTCRPSFILIRPTVWPQYTNVTDRRTDRTDKPVGFHGPIASPVSNAPSSECPQFRMPRASIAARRRAAGSIAISRQASCCCSSAIARITIAANFKMYLLHQFCSNRVQTFFTIHRIHRRKNDGPEF